MSKSRTKIKHQLKQGEPGGLNRHWRSLFLDYLAESSNVKQSAAKAGINPSRAYKVRREEPEFARQWLASLYGRVASGCNCLSRHAAVESERRRLLPHLGDWNR